MPPAPIQGQACTTRIGPSPPGPQGLDETFRPRCMHRSVILCEAGIFACSELCIWRRSGPQLSSCLLSSFLNFARNRLRNCKLAIPQYLQQLMLHDHVHAGHLHVRTVMHRCARLPLPPHTHIYTHMPPHPHTFTGKTHVSSGR